MSWLKTITQTLLSEFVFQFLFKQLKRKAVVGYMKVVEAMRVSMIFTVFIFFSLQMMALSFFGLTVTGLWLFIDQDINTKLSVLCICFAALFIIPLIAVFILLSSKTWLKISGAEEMLKEMK